MEDFVSMGAVNGRYYVLVTERRHAVRHGPFPSWEDGREFAAAESNRLGIGPAYVGVPARF